MIIYQLRKLTFLRWCAKSCLFLGGEGLIIRGHTKKGTNSTSLATLRDHITFVFVKTGIQISVFCCCKSKNCTQTGYIHFITYYFCLYIKLRKGHKKEITI